jgi:hypothetical protein
LDQRPPDDVVAAPLANGKLPVAELPVDELLLVEDVTLTPSAGEEVELGTVPLLPRIVTPAGFPTSWGPPVDDMAGVPGVAGRTTVTGTLPRETLIPAARAAGLSITIIAAQIAAATSTRLQTITAPWISLLGTSRSAVAHHGIAHFNSIIRVAASRKLPL